MKNKFRIVEKTNTISNEKLYECQVKSRFFGWFTCEVELGWGCSTQAIFPNKEDAENYIHERQVQEAWK